jgi:dimethylaniline monooxygenase (N-oxide forming)
MRIAVVGAGAAGLAAAKALREVGESPVVFEATDTVGGLWVDRPDGVAYASLKTNTSREITAFSDFPFSGDLPTYPPRAEVERYLRDYAAAFGLRRLVRFGHRVEAVRPSSSGWSITVQTMEGQRVQEFDAVLMCVGIFSTPVVPPIPGLDTFAGEVLHSKYYHSPEPFRGRSVVVVGLGSSANDIAVDLAGVASGVVLSVRRGAAIAPRTVAGRPVDHGLNRMQMLLPRRLIAWRGRGALQEATARLGFPSAHAPWDGAGVPFNARARVLHDGLGPALRDRCITLRPAIERIADGEVIFVGGGARIRPDTIVFATGYRTTMPALPGDLQPWTDIEHGLYRLVFPPSSPSLAFVGVCRVGGPVPPVVEMQSRWAARVLTGRLTLPSEAEMRREVAARWERTATSGEAPFQVALLPYLDEIARLIGVKPHLWRHPTLLWHMLAGPPLAAHYRLEGPNPWPSAAERIRRGS